MNLQLCVCFPLDTVLKLVFMFLPFFHMFPFSRCHYLSWCYLCSTICLIISLLLNGSHASLALLRVMINHWLIQFNRHKGRKTWVIIIFCNWDAKFRPGITFNLGTRLLYASQLTPPLQGCCSRGSIFPEWQPRAREQQTCSRVGLPELWARLPLYCLSPWSQSLNLFTSQLPPL